MRFMVITKADAGTESGRMGSDEGIQRMGAFIEEMIDAGILLSADGLHPSKEGARIYFDGAKKTVVDGPFAETKELVGGFFMVETKSLDECVEWFKRCPAVHGDNIEIRRVIMPEDMTDQQRADVERREASAAAIHGR